MSKKSGYGNTGAGGIKPQFKPTPKSGGAAKPGTHSVNSTYAPSPSMPSGGKHGKGNPY